MSPENTTMIKRFVIDELPNHPEVMEYLKTQGGYEKIFSRYLQAQQLESINQGIRNGDNPITWEKAESISDRYNLGLQERMQEKIRMQGLPKIVLVVEYDVKDGKLQDIWYLPPLE